MGDHQLRLGAVNLGPFVGVDKFMWPVDRLYNWYRADMDVKWIKQVDSVQYGDEIICLFIN